MKLFLNNNNNNNNSNNNIDENLYFIRIEEKRGNMFQKSSEKKMYVGDFYANNLSSLGTLPQRLHIPTALIGLINYPVDNSIDCFTDMVAILISIVTINYYGMLRGHPIMFFETIEIKMAAVSAKRSINFMVLVLWLVIHPVNRTVNLQAMIIVERLDGYIPNND